MLRGTGGSGHVTTVGFKAPTPLLGGTGLWGGGVEGWGAARGAEGPGDSPWSTGEHSGARAGYGAGSPAQPPTTPQNTMRLG